MWGLGCCLYEILSAALESAEEALEEEENQEDNRHVLFKGQFCFPLSPNPNAEDEKISIYQQHDHLY